MLVTKLRGEIPMSNFYTHLEFFTPFFTNEALMGILATGNVLGNSHLKNVKEMP